MLYSQNFNYRCNQTALENWYSNNMTSYTNDYIEDAVYCNDRSIYNYAGWDPNGGVVANNYYLKFGAFGRESNPSVMCQRDLDKFTVSSSNGNGALTYPVGLITSDEVMYAGGHSSINNSTYYLYTNQKYWSLTPHYYSTSALFMFVQNNGRNISGTVGNNNGLRPVISLKSTDIVESGDGTQTNPYVIQTS